MYDVETALNGDYSKITNLEYYAVYTLCALYSLVYKHQLSLTKPRKRAANKGGRSV